MSANCSATFDDTPEVQAAINVLYRQESRLFQNLFLPSVKPLRKERAGSRLCRRYAVPRTPLERVEADPTAMPHLTRLPDRLDPFALAPTIDRKFIGIYALASGRRGPRRRSARPRPRRSPPRRRTTRAHHNAVVFPAALWQTSQQSARP